MDKEKVDPEIQEFLAVEQQKAQLQEQVLISSTLVSTGWSKKTRPLYIFPNI